ncbi:acyl-CoA dehydrogenase [Streptomyces acidiscabies]|uniref:Acyl-CoA dehydrogenase n=1 Tax=Streptomyces acidiscabies TaxID=42234 RepID=A0AAP6BK65_9ACTN|nr:acyl-CoA dehydrogenase [Streptomyces acidiscabies]MDX2966238.1 acyl-CoA dehydrogenase [Streptomyces acidiscabies]MDX3025603.1 acyl-CoA dehydrogenase [Streptomyces acidiscabies]MDX3796221.1 acyl-CoA dehydrogenase [Streptomyces acidiscabies]GAQ58365.1 acyl-CoA dehydrogenase, middle domain [Streptomyces acidiscabies]GAV44190.1 acyl-CoA dehydrogenase, middle domain [Streptomyces acidiscabies]
MLITTTRPTLRELLFEDGVHTTHRHTITHPVFRHRPHATTEERWRLTYDRLRHVHDQLPFPAEHLANNPRHLAALHEWTSVVDGATATVAGIHYNLFLGSILDDQDSPPRDLTPFTNLTRTGTFLCTEEAHGNDASALETTATYDRATDAFTLHTPHPGAAKFMPNTSPAGGAKTAVVAARLLTNGRDEGVFLFLTPLTDSTGTPLPGITITPLPERIGSPVDHCTTTFTNVPLPRTSLIQGPHGRLQPDGTIKSLLGSPRKRFLTAIDRVTTGKLCMSASTLGGARAALTVAARYAEHRKVSAPTGGTTRIPISAYTTHHSRLLARVATAYAMTFLHRAVMDEWLSHSATGPVDAVGKADAAGKWLSHSATEPPAAAPSADQWLNHSPTEPLVPDQRLSHSSTEPPAATAQADQWPIHSPTHPLTPDRPAAERLVAIAKGWITYQARDIVTECRERCGARGLFPVNGLADYPANAEGAITAEGDNLAVWSKAGAEMLFAHDLAEEQPKATGAESVTDVTFLRRALSTAERHWHQTARTALRAPGTKGGAFARWNNAALPALTLVETHALAQASDAFARACTRADSPELTALHALFLLRHLQPYEGLLLAEGAFTPDQTRALPTARATLTTYLAPHLTTLTDAFDVPEEHLNSLPLLTP